MKLCLCDLDGVIADPQARFTKAQDAKQAYLVTSVFIDVEMDKEQEKKMQSLYWREAFNPLHVPLDTLIEGADGDIVALALQDYEIVFLTSRPAAMRDATIAWLEQFDLLAANEHERLIMKQPAFQYVKTVVWKAGIVQTLAAMLDATEVLFVSDEQKEIDELQRYQHSFALRCALSLDKAVNGEEEDDAHPF